MDSPVRTDLAVTTAIDPTPEQRDAAHRCANELHAPILPRRGVGLPKLFDANPLVQTLLVIRADRWTLVKRTGEEFFCHPSTGYLRMSNVLRGGRDLLLDAAQLRPGDTVLDATLGYGGEAVLCSYAVGETGKVDGIEAVPEIGILVREGLQTVVTHHAGLNAAMRRIRVVHLGDHLDYLRTCGDASYDVVCFDPFFDDVLPRSETFAPIRVFGNHAPLLPEALAEARRVARRCVVVKSSRRSNALLNLGIKDVVTSRSSKVAYGVLTPTPRFG